MHNIGQSAPGHRTDRSNVNMAAKEEDRKFILDVIQLYRELPALWKIKDKIYSDRSKKNAAYETLLAKYRGKRLEASKEDLKKRLNSLRTNYRKELKKVQDSMKSGASMDDVYESTLWYYDEMGFLQDQETPARSTSTITTATEGEQSEDEDDMVSTYYFIHNIHLQNVFDPLLR